ncbi:MAG: molybdopterin molybdenumtransferase MoeA [Pseudomonadota bacterium]|jgi:molybdopterin molybdotransferase
MALISYSDALIALRAEAMLQAVESVDLYALAGRVVAEDVVAGISVPSFNNSAMDGFALQASLTAGASETAPLTFAVGDCLAAGDVSASVSVSVIAAGNSLGQAVEIMTGAKVPDGYDAVVPIERVSCVRDVAGKTLEIRLSHALRAGENVRYAAEDFQAGIPVVSRSTRLHAGHVAALAATGVGTVKVYKTPTVAVIATGKEISDCHGQPLADGEIYNSNAPYLINQLNASGLAATYAGNIGDDEAHFARLLDELSEARIIISSGAVSKGRWDFIPEILKQRGARIVFHGVAIKPGKPVLFAVLPDGRYYFGLPGNPISAAVGLRFFVQPLIRAILGMPEEQFLAIPLAQAFNKKGPMFHFLKAKRVFDENGQARLDVLDGQESFKISPMLAMNGWALVEEKQSNLASGSLVRFAEADLFSTNE